MIGFALKKFASQNGMLTSHGVAYGSLRGYSATLSEGSGYKQIVFTTCFSDPALEKAFWDEVNAAPLRKNYRVQSINVAGKNVQIVFADNPGTMKKLEKFVDWFVSLLKKYEVSRCFYGHLHGASHGLAIEGLWDGIDYKLVAADKLNFDPFTVIL